MVTHLAHALFVLTAASTMATNVHEAYEVCLDRTPSTAEVEYWIERCPGSVDLICDSPEARKLVVYLYGAALNREPEPGALEYWTAQPGHDIINGIIFSPEAMND